jgi:hypothetical protein
MGVAALGLSASIPTGLALLGALVFMLSDTILAAEKFRLDAGQPFRRVAPYLVWAFYWGGQALITYGILAAI